MRAHSSVRPSCAAAGQAHAPIILRCLAVIASAFLHKSVAFTTPRSRHAALFQSRGWFGHTELRSGTTITSGDEGDDSTPKSKTTRKAQKGTSRKMPNVSAAKTRGRTKGARKNGEKSRKKGQPIGKKRPVEISTQLLSSSQIESDAVQTHHENESSIDDGDDRNYAYNIPKTGYSLADQLENQSPESRERFKTTLTPIVTGVRAKNEVEFEYDEDGFPVGFREVGDEEGEGRRHEGVARIDTISTLGNAGEEPVKWLVSLGEIEDGSNGEDQKESFAMIDLPPYSDKLADEMRAFMDPEYNVTTLDDSNGKSKASLDAILLTNQQCIHYDASPAVYVTRKSDLTKWKDAFPNAEAVMYRLDIPRECREEVTQVLDGYGPWGWGEDEEGRPAKFVETGRPLTIEEWDDDTKSKVLSMGELPPEDQVDGEDAVGDNAGDDESLYTPEVIRQREEKYRLLAVYTPGHTFGSVTYIFPQRGICCSGYTLPLESSIADGYADEDDDADLLTGSSPMPQRGPRLDYQGYLATSASRPRQMSSALSLINKYSDRFRVVLPARGDVVFLDVVEETRKRELIESVGLYQKMGDIYGRLGIVE